MIEERVFFKGQYYIRRQVDMRESGDTCEGCCFWFERGCTEPTANCLSTGCGPCAIFIEETDES